MKNILLSAVVIISMSACSPSQEDILKEKQKLEKIRLEKIRLEKIRLEKDRETEQKKLNEAKKYLSLKNDNDSVWKKITKVHNQLDRSIYETEAEYNKRITLLNKEVFNRKFIFDYKPKYMVYDVETKKLYLSVYLKDVRRDRFNYKYGLFPRNKLVLVSKFMGVLEINGYPMKKFKRLRSNFVHSNTEGVNLLKNPRKGLYQSNYEQSAVLIKDNCSPEEAQKIQRDWKIRFVSNLNYRKKIEGQSVFAKNFDIVNTEMVIIYNKKTNEIYKVLY